MSNNGNLNKELTEKMDIFVHWLQQYQRILLDFAINIAIAIIILLVGVFIARKSAQIFNKIMVGRKLEVTIANFLSSLIRYMIITFTVIAALSHVGIQTTSFIAVLGAAGLAIGLALQGALSNFAAGVLLVIFRPFKAAEYVNIGGVEGTVQSIQIFSTTLLTGDGKIIVVPNGKIIAGNIINVTREPYRRLQIIIGVSYDSDIDQVKQVITEVINAHDKVIKSKGITVRLNELADSSLNFVVRVWTTNEDYGSVNFDLLENFKRALDANKITMPYPQLDVHHSSQ